MKLSYTRKIIDAIHNGSLLKANYRETPVFKLLIPDSVEGVPSDILQPENTVHVQCAVVLSDFIHLGEVCLKSFLCFQQNNDHSLLEFCFCVSKIWHSVHVLGVTLSSNMFLKWAIHLICVTEAN